MANNLYGGTLRLQNGFTSVLQQFKSQMSGAGSALNNFNNLTRCAIYQITNIVI